MRHRQRFSGVLLAAAVFLAGSPAALGHSQRAFPAFGHTVFPVAKAPNWGAMHTPSQWERTYAQLTTDDFVPIPSYDLDKMTTPLETLVREGDTEDITRKLFYSTKFLATYDVDASDYSGMHPGIDIKLPIGTPVSAIAGGRVQTISADGPLGLHVVIEHRHPTDGTFYSIYGHLRSTTVREGQAVAPGFVIGTVGVSGSTTGAHLHLQVDRGHGEAVHEPYIPKQVLTPAEADRWTMHPVRFIEKYAQ